MARVSKFSDVDKKRFERTETQRQQDENSKKKYYLIVCEGTKTEPNYFKSIKQHLKAGTINLVELVDIVGTGRNPSNVVNEAQKVRERFLSQPGHTLDETWAIFDRDSFPEEDFNNAISRGGDINIKCAWTNESFELWYLLHFQFFQNGMSRSSYGKLIERELSKKLGKKYKYEKNSLKMFALLQEHGNVKQAIEWSKRLEMIFIDRTDYANHNPCSKVYQLIEKLLFPKPGQNLDIVDHNTSEQTL